MWIMCNVGSFADSKHIQLRNHSPVNTAASRQASPQSPERSVCDSSWKIPYWWRQSAQNSGIASEWYPAPHPNTGGIVCLSWMADSVNRKLTVDIFKLHFVESHSEVMSEFCADWRHQYGILGLKSQTLLSGDWGEAWRKAAVFTGYIIIWKASLKDLSLIQ